MNAAELLSNCPLLPVVALPSVDQAVPLAHALLEAGITTMEVTLRTEAALPAIRTLKSEVPQMCVGAGSVRFAAQFEEIKGAGAAFAVSPGYSQTLLTSARQHRLPYVPGAATPSECLQLLEAGYTLQKFFPAELSGGVAAIRQIVAPLPEVSFCVTGGINPGNVAHYTACEAVACIGGSWFVAPDLIEASNFARITQLASEAVALVNTSAAAADA